MRSFIKNLGSLALAGTSLLSACGPSGSKETNSALMDLSYEAMTIMAGEDQVIDGKDKSNFLKEMGFKGYIDENATLTIKPKGRGYRVYEGHSSDHVYSIGTITQERLIDYINRHKTKIGEPK